MSELKPCPFCGAKPNLFARGNAAWVQCFACLCGTGVMNRSDLTFEQNVEKAIEAWNRRDDDGD